VTFNEWLKLDMGVLRKATEAVTAADKETEAQGWGGKLITHEEDSPHDAFLTGATKSFAAVLNHNLSFSVAFNDVVIAAFRIGVAYGRTERTADPEPTP